MFVYDLVDVAEVTGFVRDLEFPELVLDGILPNKEVPDINYAFSKATISRRAAQYRAWDTEAPIARRGPLSQVEGEIPGLSEKIRFGEYDILRSRARMGDTGAQQQIVDTIYDDAKNRAFAIQARAEIARGDLLTDGKVTISENGFHLEVDFGLPGTHIVAPLGALWSNHGAADVIGDLRLWMAVWKADNNGRTPGAIVVSDQVLSDMLLNAALRDLAQANGITPAFLNAAQLNTIFSAHGLPPVVTYDGELEDHTGAAVRPIPADRVLMVPANGADLGQTFYGTTAEALELVSEGKLDSRAAPGIVVVVDKTFDPVATWTKAAGIILPVLTNPNALLVADVR